VSIELALGALLAAAAVVFVAVPFLRAGEATASNEPAQEALVAAEERDRALAELKELEFDHRTGKITDEDYRALVQPLRRRAATAIANGASLPDKTSEQASQQHFSGSSASSSRQDR
jgi:cytochrome c-type biogenesis protein CcmI